MVKSDFLPILALFWPEIWVLFEITSELDIILEKSQYTFVADMSTANLRPFTWLCRFRSWSETALIMMLSDKDYRLFMNIVCNGLFSTDCWVFSILSKWNFQKIRDASRIFTKATRNISSSWRILETEMVSCSFGAFLVIFRALDEKEKLLRDVSDKEKKIEGSAFTIGLLASSWRMKCHELTLRFSFWG